MRFYLPLLLILFLCTCVRAQKSQDLREDAPFFEEQAQRYQNWLDRTGLGQYLKYRELEVKKDELAIYLEFKATDLDTIISQWNTLKATFEETAIFSLERTLFYQANILMEVPDSALSVQLYDTYDLSKEPLFSRVVYLDEEKVQLQESNPKSPIVPIRLAPRKINGKSQSIAGFQLQRPCDKIYDCIIAYAKSRYRNRGINGADPEIRVTENEEILSFEVIDLKHEVLPSHFFEPICEKMGFDCPKREFLTFRFVCEQTNTGIRVSGDIDGKFGSGLYNYVRRGAYQPMKPEYEAELKSYIGAITVEIKKFLQSCP